MTTQSASERLAGVSAAAEAAERQWGELNASYDLAAAAEHDALVSGDIATSERHRAAATEHRQAALALQPRLTSLRAARDELAAEVAAEQHRARYAELQAEHRSVLRAYEAAARRYGETREAAAVAYVHLEQLDTQLQHAERELEGYRAVDEAQEVGGIVLLRQHVSHSRLGGLLQTEADVHGAQVGPTLARGLTHPEYGRQRAAAADRSS